MVYSATRSADELCRAGSVASNPSYRRRPRGISGKRHWSDAPPPTTHSCDDFGVAIGRKSNSNTQAPAEEPAAYRCRQARSCWYRRPVAGDATSVRLGVVRFKLKVVLAVVVNVFDRTRQLVGASEIQGQTVGPEAWVSVETVGLGRPIAYAGVGWRYAVRCSLCSLS